MITELSILIPTYNTTCIQLVKRLQQLCEQISRTAGERFDYEIIVADDASSDSAIIAENCNISQIPHCFFIQKTKNEGSAATRNFLADHSHFRWMLFVDCDIEVLDDHFLRRYLPYDQADIVNGGIRTGGERQSNNLRFLYEEKSQRRHDAKHRQMRPYQSFRSTNFIITRTCMERCHFDERFTKSGYEDVHFGLILDRQKARIEHIDNPVYITDFENNVDYLSKCERNLHTLHAFRHELGDYSPLLALAKRLAPIIPILRLLHRICSPWERRNLTGRHPSLLLFQLYRLGYYVSIDTK